MALYLGSSDQQKIILDGVVYRFNLFTSTPIEDFIRLLSSDNYILQDINGVYLIPNDYVESIVDNSILSLDSYILKDKNELYLTVKEEK